MDGNFALYYPINTSKNDNNSTTNKQCAISEFRNIKKNIINKLFALLLHITSTVNRSASEHSLTAKMNHFILCLNFISFFTVTL